MDDIRLPGDVIDRLERRWSSRLLHDAKTWSTGRSRPAHARHVQDGARDIPVVVKHARAVNARIAARYGSSSVSQ
jgi:hypothetical protein